MQIVALSKIASEIAYMLSLKHNKKIAYRTITQNKFCVMVGFCVEPNRFSSSAFSIRYFIQPLYIPCSHVDLSLGDIVGEWEKKNITEALRNIQDCFERYISIDDISTIINRVNSRQLPFFGSLDNRYEFFAYSYLAINKYDKALYYLNQLISLEKVENAIWYEAQIKRAKNILDLINHEKWELIKSELLKWQKETITNLHLSDAFE